MNYVQTVKEVLLLEAQELEYAANNIDKYELEKAINLILKTKGKLIITGIGKSGLIGTKIAATFSSTGTSSFFIHPTEAMHGDLGMIGKNDIVFAISYSGESEELIQILPHIKRFDIPLIAMANNKSSTLAKYSDIFFNIKVAKEACPLDTAPTSSTTLSMAIGDALAICLMKKRGFNKENFASFHPGGSLGKKLFIKISDLLRTKNLPIVSRETKLKDALITMSQGKLGSVIVVDKNKKIEAILSDGDVRRALLNKNFSMESLVFEYATKNPIIFKNADILASDAIKFIEEYKIQLLIIANYNEELIGLVHLHDIIQAGIK